MFGNLLGKKEQKEVELDKPKEIEEKEEEPINKEEENSLVIKTNKDIDFDTQQCIDMGLDIKENVKKASYAFFNSKNKEKASAYLKFENYLAAIPMEKIRELQKMQYLDFLDKEEKISTILKNGFAQSISKGASLNEESRKIIDFVFGDIKKFPSKAHRYWYYKIYIWQKREEN